MNAGNVEDTPMAVVLMIRLCESVTPQVASFGLSVLPGRIAKLPISVPSSLLFDCLEGAEYKGGMECAAHSA